MAARRASQAGRYRDWDEFLLTLDDYIIFDCPGQVELFTHHDSLRRIFSKLEKLDYRVELSNVELTSARRCEPG